MSGSGVAVLLVLVVGIYMMPWFVALARSHSKATGIFVLNLLTGWTFFGWVAALVWAVSGE